METSVQLFGLTLGKDMQYKSKNIMIFIDMITSSSKLAIDYVTIPKRPDN